MGYTVKKINGELAEYAFDFGGLIALRNFTARTNGNRLIIQSAENANFTILDALVNEVEIDGVVYDDVTSAQEALQRLVFNPNPPVILKQSVLQNILNLIQQNTDKIDQLSEQLQQCCENNPTFYNLQYNAGENGSIEGFTSQTVQRGLNGSPVTAKPESGYKFSKWSDGNTDITRVDVLVQGDITVTALFVEKDAVYEFLSDKDAVTLPGVGGDDTVAVTSKKNEAAEEYEITSSPEWCTTSKNAAGVRVSADKNE